jgi:hypothetical protein
MTHEGVDIHRFGGIQRRNRDSNRRSAMRKMQRHEEIDYPEEKQEEDFNPLEEADEWGHSLDEEFNPGEEAGKWGRKGSTLIKGKTRNSSQKESQSTNAKGHPLNMYRGKSPFRKTKKSWGVPWL